MDCYVSMCSCRFMGCFILNPQARNKVARSVKSVMLFSVGEGVIYSPAASDMHFVRDMRSARDMSFGRDMRYARFIYV